MRLVNVKTIKSVTTIYNHIPQPMYVYHSTEEFEGNVPNNKNAAPDPVSRLLPPTNCIIIKGMGDYYEFLNGNKINTDYDPDNVYVDLRKYNVWIKTVDKFVPDYADQQGNIFYKPDTNGNPIPTDGVYIRLYFLTPTPSRHVLYTSSGLHTVGMSKWDMTGAERASFLQEKIPSTKGKAYEDKLARLLRTKKTTVNFMKLAMSLMVSESESFLDIDKSVKAAFGQSIRAADRLKLLESPAFRSSLMATLKTLYPTLAPEIRKLHTPEEMAKRLATMWGKAEGSGDIDKMTKVFDKITEVGYKEHTELTDNTVPIVPLISDRPKQIGDDTVELPDYTKLAEEELAKRKEEQDYPVSYVMPELEEDEKTEAEV